MKKAEKAIPNHLLKQERELHGWSQKYVAEHIGANSYYVSRWERGTALPSPHYRQQLCSLFGKNAKELGILQEEQCEDSKRDYGENISHLSTLSLDTGVTVIDDPTIPLLPQENLIGRDALLNDLKQRLNSGVRQPYVALVGLPGVGKTAIARELAHDQWIQTQFYHGTLWARLGTAPDVLGQLRRWGTLLGLSPMEKAQLRSKEDWALAVRSALGRRRLLLVIDDAWTIEDALAFKVGGPNCAYLITTRRPEIAARIASEGVIFVQELQEKEGVHLLRRLAPFVVKAEPQAACTLVQAVGGLPLALTLVGNYLRVQAQSQQPRRIQQALTHLQYAEKRLQLEQAQASLEHHSNLSKGTPLSLQTVIGVSYAALDTPSQNTFRTLSVFSAKPNTFSENAALYVAAVDARILDSLVDAGLLESCGSDRYTLHQTIADYAKIYHSDRTGEQRMLEYFANYVATHEKDYDDLELESANIFTALHIAIEQGIQSGLVQMVNTFIPFLETRGLYRQAEIYLKQVQQVASSLEDIVLLADILLHLGRIAERQGASVQARVYYQDGLALCRQKKLDKQTISFLVNLGTLAGREGNYDQAERYSEEGLTLAHQTHLTEQVGSLLTNIAAVAFEQGKYDQAENSLQESLLIARQVGTHELVCRLLANLGVVATKQGKVMQAEAYLQEGLLEARRIGHKELIGALLMNLGSVAFEQGRDMQAATYWQESLTLAYQIENPWLISTILVEWGELHLKHQDISIAAVTFNEALEKAQGGSQELTAAAYYGLARVSYAQGDIALSHQQGELSLTIYKKLQHASSVEVSHWLQKILHKV